MVSLINLSEATSYSEDRIKSDSVSIEDFITSDNLLSNKAGIGKSVITPKGTLIAYKKGDILIGNIRPYLKKIWFANKDGGCSQDVLVIRPKRGYDPAFLYYSVLRDDFFDHMMRGSKGTKMPRGDKSQTMRFLIPDFELDYQQRIGNLLSDIDSKISLNNRINAELEAMAKTIYDYWFVQFDFPISAAQAASMGKPDKKGKPYKASGGKMVWSDELKREIPEGWVVGTLLDIADFINGIACQKFRPNDGEPFYRVIKIREMGEGFSNSSEFVSRNIPSKVLINNGDILFSWSATLDVKIWSGGTGVLNQHIFKVTSPQYPRSYFYFETLRYLQHFKMIADLRKTTMGHITQDHLKQSRIAIPPLNLIESLHKIIDPIINKIVLNNEENQKLTELRDWLLPMLMNGQIKIKDVEHLSSKALAKDEESPFAKASGDKLAMAAELEVTYKRK
jgi:type I restriction enzyme, S subunit